MVTDDAKTTKRFQSDTITKLKGKYAAIVDQIQDIIEEKNINIKKLILRLSAADDENLTLFSSDEAFVKITDTNELFLQIGKYCSMYDFELLLVLVVSTQCQEAVKLLDDFKKELHCSILRELNLLSEDGELLNPSDFMPGTHKLIIKYVGGKCTLKAMEKIQNVIYECFHLEKGSITFKGVEEGCIAFVYQISAAVKSHILRYEVTPNNITMLAEQHITSILIDNVKLKISLQLHEVIILLCYKQLVKNQL